MRGKMRLRKENILWNVMLGTGAYLLDSLRDRLAGGVEDLTDRASDAYSEASRRVSRASDVIRGADHRGLGTAAAILLGIGVGASVGILLAPASGEETRDNLKEKMRERFSREAGPATGTYGQ